MPKQMSINGKKHMLYQIGELSGLAGRDAITVRKWEGYGYIPRAAIRDSRGQRLYFKEEVESLVKIMNEEVPRAGIGFQKTRFKERVFSEWNKIRSKYLNNGGNGDEGKNDKEKSESKVFTGINA